MRLIDADELKKAFEDCTGDCACCIHNTNDFEYCGLIDNAPTVPQVTVFAETADEKAVADLKAELQSVIESRPRGEWIKITKNGTIPVEYICSVCGRKIFDNYELSVPQSVYYPFCHCGADMRGNKE